jgi:hypothetical protein
MYAWRFSDEGREGPSNITQTPHRPRFGEIFATPDVQRPRRVAPVESAKKPVLPGFFNSFADTGTPTKSTSRHAKDKGKGKVKESMVVGDDGHSFFALKAPSSPGSPLDPISMKIDNDYIMEDIVPLPEGSQEIVGAPVLATANIEDDDVGMDEEPHHSQHEELHAIEPPNWRDEVRDTLGLISSAIAPSYYFCQLHRTLFIHTLPGRNVPTLQTLLNSPVPSSAPPELQQAYASACASIIEHFGIHMMEDDWEAYLRVFSAALVSMANVLTTVAAVSSPSIMYIVWD